MRVLIACEESQTECKAFRDIGCEAYSCDIQEPSGGHPEWHIHSDVLPIINGNCSFYTMDGEQHTINGKWDLLIAHPPCTYMSKAGARWMFQGGNINQDRLKKRKEAKEFFMKFIEADCDRIAVENPQPMKIVELPLHSQEIQPYEYGEHYSKKTYLWLKNLPYLTPTKPMKGYVPYLPSNTGGGKRGQKARPKSISQKDSSKSFEGIARAMAEQWTTQKRLSTITEKNIQTSLEDL